MAELVDALDSKSGYRKVVQVRFLFWAQSTLIWVLFLCLKVYKTGLFACFSTIFTVLGVFASMHFRPPVVPQAKSTVFTQNVFLLWV